MKIILSLLFVLMSVPAFAQGIYLPVATGTVTQANMKISAVDGTAFVDHGYTYQSDFSADTNGWTAVNGTVTGNIDSIGGQDNNLRFTCNNASGSHLAYIVAFSVLKRTKVTFSIYIPSTNSNVDSIRILSSYWGFDEIITPTPDTWVTYTRYATPPTLTTFPIHFADGGIASFQDVGGDDTAYIRGVTTQEYPLADYTGNLLVVRDSSGRAIQGFIKAVGTAETEGTELATGTCTAGKLYKITVTEVNHFGTDKVVGNYFTSAGTETLDASNKVKEISTPSATGATIVSTKGGTAYNWATKNSAFNYNDSSGYTYQIYKVLNAPVVDSDACTNANATINLTAGSAAWSCTGIDDSAYQDGKHIIAVYDAAGVAAFGYYKASGSGAVVNAKSGSTQNWISIGAGFSTAGNYTRKVLYVGD